MIEIYENTAINEKLYYRKSPSGMDVYIIPKEGFSKTYAYVAFKFGGRDTQMIIDGQLAKFPEGTAHFLEHKLFESREKDLFKRFNEKGASVNAFTNTSSTVYYFSCTEQVKENLHDLLFMVQSFDVTQEDVEREKKIIHQEIAMYRDQADWQLYHRTLRAMYHKHPIKQSVAGDESSVDDIDLETLVKAYHAFYTPGNSFVLIVGDVVPQQVLDWVEDSLTIPFRNRLSRLESVAPSEPNGVKFDRVAYPFAVGYTKCLFGFKDNQRPLTGKALYKHSLVVRVMQELFLGRASELYNRLYQSGVVNATFGVDYLFDVDYGFTLIGGDNMDPETVFAAMRAYGNELKEQLSHGTESEFYRDLDVQFEQVKRRALGRYLMSYNGLDFIGHHFVTHILKGINPLNYVELVETIDIESVINAFMSQIHSATPSIVTLDPLKHR